MIICEDLAACEYSLVNEVMPGVRRAFVQQFDERLSKNYGASELACAEQILDIIALGADTGTRLNGQQLPAGPRGAGKSFFLRLLQATLNRKPMPEGRFVLLPEELHNVYAPHELTGSTRAAAVLEQALPPKTRHRLGLLAAAADQDAG